MIFQSVIGLSYARAAKSVGFENVRSGTGIVPMDLSDDLRLSDGEQIIISFERQLREGIGSFLIKFGRSRFSKNELIRKLWGMCKRTV